MVREASINEKLDAIMRWKDLSSDQALAQYLGVHRNSISRWRRSGSDVQAANRALVDREYERLHSEYAFDEEPEDVLRNRGIGALYMLRGEELREAVAYLERMRVRADAHGPFRRELREELGVGYEPERSKAS